MGNISDKLQYLAETKEVIKAAIKNKGVAVTDSDRFRTYADRIAAIRSAATPNDVNFYDYDGVCLYSYSASEFLSLSDFPPPPYCEDREAVWNFTLNKAQEIVAKNRMLDIGALYNLGGDVLARFFLSIKTQNQLEVSLNAYFPYGKGTIDWGDGSPEETYSHKGDLENPITHAYQDVGDYCITFKSVSAQLFIEDNALSQSEDTPNTSLVAIECGYVRTIGSSFAYCTQLKTVRCSSDTELGGNSLFSNCYNLVAVIHPDKSYGLTQSAFFRCSSLLVVSAPQGQMDSPNTFLECSSLKRLCLSLYSSFAPNNTYARGCVALTQVAINSCRELEDYCFADCKSLTSMRMPASVTAIGSNAFKGCVSLHTLDFSDHTSVPSIKSNTLPERGVYRIIVPDALYDEWIAATNWSTYASQIVKASEYNG